jgi:gamma-glutamyltranspeptidase/glutathione hydrolase
MQGADLSEWQPEWVDPISTTYRGWTIYELPPNGSGIGALEMLNIMEAREISKWPAGSTDALHWRIEAMHLAYADLWHTVSDPRHVQVPVGRLTSKEFARKRADTISMERANCSAVPSEELTTSGNTTYLAVIDRDGNVASWIQSIANAWGSGVNVEGMGFHLQNRGSYFRLDSKHANALVPRKRPFHTIIPAFMEKGSLHAGFGIMGGPSQPYAHGQFVSNVADYGMNIQAAMDAARFSPARDNSCRVGIESRIPAATLEALRQRGHDWTDAGLFDMRGVGVGQVVMRDSAQRVNYGASDARGDGAAIPEPLAVDATR